MVRSNQISNETTILREQKVYHDLSRNLCSRKINEEKHFSKTQNLTSHDEHKNF